MPLGLTLMLAALALPPSTGADPAGADPIRFTATLLEDGATCRFEVAGPPGALVVLLVSPHGGGSAPPTGGRLVVQLVHPYANFLRRGTLPAGGRLSWRFAVPADPAQVPDRCFLQVAAFDPHPPHRVLGFSRAYRFRRGPPASLAVAEPGRSAWWLGYLLPLAGAAAAPLLRRRPSILLLLPAAAIACLALAPGPLAAPVRAAADARARTDRALAAHLGEELLAAVRAIRARVPARGVVWIPADLPITRIDPGYLESLLYPRQLVYRRSEAEGARAAGRPTFALRRFEAPPPPDLTSAEEPALEPPGFRLWRLLPPPRSGS